MSISNKLQTYILIKYSRNFLKLPLDHSIGLISQQVYSKKVILMVRQKI